MGGQYRCSSTLFLVILVGLFVCTWIPVVDIPLPVFWFLCIALVLTISVEATRPRIRSRQARRLIDVQGIDRTLLRYAATAERDGSAFPHKAQHAWLP